MSRSIWIKRLLPTIELNAKRAYQEEDEYRAITRREFSFKVKEADVQPLKGHELSTLEEGYRVKSVFKISTTTELIAGEDGTINLPDKVEYKGAWYSVFKVEPWVDGLENHYCAYIVSENGR